MPPCATTFVSKIALLMVALSTWSCADSAAPPPKPTRLVLLTNPPAIGETMVPLPVQPVVQTADANGAVGSGSTTITASVIAGPGEIEAGGTAITNADGVATFSGLALGGVTGQVGQLTLQFSAPGLEPATTTIGLHCAVLPLSIPQSVTRSLATGDCADPNGGYFNKFALTTSPTVTAVQLRLAGAFPGNLAVEGPNELGNLWGWTMGEGATNSDISFKALLPPGRSFVDVASNRLDVLGGYTLTTVAASDDLTCDLLTSIAASPITSVQQLGPGDCVQSSFLQDLLVVGLPANATISASMSSSAFDPWIEVRDGFTESTLVHSTGQGSANLTFTNAGASEPFFLVFTSSVAGKSGPYDFTMNIAYPSGSAARSALRLPFIGQHIVLPTKVAASRGSRK